MTAAPVDLAPMDLPPMDIASRTTRLLDAFAAADPAIDGLLVTHLTNIRYLTGLSLIHI